MAQEIEEISSITSERRSTGVVGLDFQLGGGLPKGKSIIVFGDSLSGCDLLAEQFWNADSTHESTYLMYDSTLKEGMIQADDFSPAELSNAMKGEWVVVDSISTFITRHGTEAGVELLTDGIKRITDAGGNVLFIMYSGVHTKAEETRITRYADIFLSLTQFLHGNEIERSLTVNKISGVDVPKRAYPYNIMSWGIELSTTGRVV